MIIERSLFQKESDRDLFGKPTAKCLRKASPHDDLPVRDLSGIVTKVPSSSNAPDSDLMVQSAVAPVLRRTTFLSTECFFGPNGWLIVECVEHLPTPANTEEGQVIGELFAPAFRIHQLSRSVEHRGG